MALQSLSGFTLYPPISGVAQSASGLQTIALDAAEERVCAVCQFPKTGTVKKVGIRLTARSAGDAVYRVTLETVAAVVGVPIAATYAARTLYVANAESGDVTVPAAAGVQWIALNGATGVSVTAGDLVSITVRCVSRTTGSITVAYSVYTAMYLSSSAGTLPYSYTNTGADATATQAPNFALEYDGEIVPVFGCMPAVAVAANNWDSGDNPTFRGLKFQLPFAAKVCGIMLPVFNADYDFKIHAFDSDEYTKLSGFPITVTQEQRRADAAGNAYWYTFPTPFTAAINTNYRIAIEPIETGASSDDWIYYDVTDDSALPALAGMDGGANFVYTTIDDEPTSGSHTWTDDADRRPVMGLLLSQLSDNVGTVGGGGAKIIGG
jgi:hypothetical protein